MSESLLSKKQNGVAILTLNRPKAYNSFNREMALALIAKFEDFAVDDTIFS